MYVVHADGKVAASHGELTYWRSVFHIRKTDDKVADSKATVAKSELSSERVFITLDTTRRW